MYRNFRTKRFLLKSRLSMVFLPSVDSFGIHRLGCSWWYRRQANDAVVTERSIFSEYHDYKRFFPCRGEHVRTYVSGSRCAWWQKTTNRHTYTHTLDNCSNPRFAQLRRGLITAVFHRTPAYLIPPRFLLTISSS